MLDRDDSDMLPTASWFHAADRSLMCFYGGHRGGKFACPPGAAGYNVSISEQHARRRVRVLLDAGLLEQVHSRYMITDLGVEYIEGDIDQEQLEDLNPNTSG